jgi:hypothetical protein
MDYKEKYLKYKNKYLDLKSQLGGEPDDVIIARLKSMAARAKGDRTRIQFERELVELFNRKIVSNSMKHHVYNFLIAMGLTHSNQIPPEPTTEGHNLNVVYESWGAGGNNRIEQYDDLLAAYNSSFNAAISEMLYKLADNCMILDHLNTIVDMTSPYNVIASAPTQPGMLPIQTEQTYIYQMILSQYLYYRRSL